MHSMAHWDANTFCNSPVYYVILLSRQSRFTQCIFMSRYDVLVVLNLFTLQFFDFNLSIEN